MSDMLHRAQLERWHVKGKRYHDLPPELEHAYAYISDQGHTIIVLIDELMQAGEHVDDYLLPVPVRLVLHMGYNVDANGYVHLRMGQGMSYDSRIGLTLPEGYDEW